MLIVGCGKLEESRAGAASLGRPKLRDSMTLGLRDHAESSRWDPQERRRGVYIYLSRARQEEGGIGGRELEGRGKWMKSEASASFSEDVWMWTRAGYMFRTKRTKRGEYALWEGGWADGVGIFYFIFLVEGDPMGRGALLWLAKLPPGRPAYYMRRREFGGGGCLGGTRAVRFGLQTRKNNWGGCR